MSIANGNKSPHLSIPPTTNRIACTTEIKHDATRPFSRKEKEPFLRFLSRTFFVLHSKPASSGPILFSTFQYYQHQENQPWILVIVAERKILEVWDMALCVEVRRTCWLSDRRTRFIRSHPVARCLERYQCAIAKKKTEMFEILMFAFLTIVLSRRAQQAGTFSSLEIQMNSSYLGSIWSQEAQVVFIQNEFPVISSKARRLSQKEEVNCYPIKRSRCIKPWNRNRIIP